MPAERGHPEQSVSQRTDPYSRRKGLKDSRTPNTPPSTSPTLFYTTQPLPQPLATAYNPSPNFWQWPYPHGYFAVATTTNQTPHPLPSSYAHLVHAREQPKGSKSEQSSQKATSPAATGEGKSSAETSVFAKGVTSLLKELPSDVKSGVDTAITASDILHNIDQIDWDKLMVEINWSEFSDDELPYWLARFFRVRDLWLEDKRRRTEEANTLGETAGLGGGEPGESSEKAL